MIVDGMRPYVWMLCGCFWFSLMGLSAHALGPLADWQLVAVARSGLATVFALAVALIVGAKLTFFRPRILWVRSITGSCSMVATFYALTHLPVSDVLTMQNMAPVWLALMSWPLAGERPTLAVWGAVGCAVTGVVLTQQPDLLTGRHTGMPPAAWSALGASFFTACAMLGLNRLRGVSSLGVVVHFSGVATVFCGASFFLFERTIGTGQLANPTVLALLLAVGGTATIGQIFLTIAFRSGSPTKVSVVALSQVVMVMTAEAVIGWKVLTPISLVGTALVLGPTAWLMTREARNARKAAIDAAAPAVHRVESSGVDGQAQPNGVRA